MITTRAPDGANNKNKVGPELLGQLKMIPLTLFTMKLDYVVNRKENN